MLKFIEQKLSEFRSCFSRAAAYNWFLVIVIGLMIRFDSLGIKSFIRALSLDSRYYESMLHFFRSEAFITQELKNRWHKIVFRCAPFIISTQETLDFSHGRNASRIAREFLAPASSFLFNKD